MKRALLTMGTFALLSIFGVAQAGGDAAAGKAKAASCAGCHGANGEGVKPNPALAGLPEQIRGFGHIKLRSVEAARQKRAALMAELHGMAAPTAKAA